MFTAKTKSLNLIKDLAQFGLNPEEWWVLSGKDKNTTEFDIIHKHDTHFQFKGYTKKSHKSQWERITLFSI